MKISEIERLTCIPAATVRYWEERGLIHAERSENRYREYSEADAQLLYKIKSFREIGIAIADIKLWRDGVIDVRTLLLEHRKHIDSDDMENRKILERCNAMLAGENSSEAHDKPFAESEKLPEGEYVLGVDVGTTSVSAQLISLEDGSPIHTYSIDHEAAVVGADSDSFAADAEKLCSVAVGLVKSAIGAYPKISAIGITGQMHGIVCLDSEAEILSPLYTWQNQFGLRKLGDETICRRIEHLTGVSVPTGYGLVTFYALKELGMLPEGTEKIACIADLVVMRLCGLKAPVSHPTNATSLGLFDNSENRFELPLLYKLGISESVLPEIAEDFGICGYFENIPVAVSIGDNQAGVFGSVRENEILLNVGTSGQVSFVGEKINNGSNPENAAYEVRPYFCGKALHTGSVLCGGRALAILADMIAEIARGLGTTVSKKQIYELINSSALLSSGSLEISTSFSGTRSAPEKRGSMMNIGVDNFKISEIADGFCRGIIGELYGLYREMTDEKADRLVISGNALRRSPALKACAEKIFGCPAMMPCHIEEAAYGAALFAAVSAKKITPEKSRNLIHFKA